MADTVAPHSRRPSPACTEDSVDMGPLAKYKGCPPDAIPIDALPEPPPKVLIVTIASAEMNAVLRRLKPLPNSKGPGRLVIAGIPLTVGQLGGRLVIMYKSEQSDVELGQVVTRLLGSDKLKVAIELVFAVGFAYGTNPATVNNPSEDDQLIGDVFLPNVCFHTGLRAQRSHGLEYRGDVQRNYALASVLSQDLVRNWPENKEEWEEVSDRSRPPKVHIGTVMSAPVLYDNGDRLKEDIGHPQIRPHKPLGGEMELYQLVAAAEHNHKKWLLAKAVCDFGGIKAKSDIGHNLASATAADFADWLLRQEVMSHHLGVQDDVPAARTNLQMIEDINTCINEIQQHVPLDEAAPQTELSQRACVMMRMFLEATQRERMLNVNEQKVVSFKQLLHDLQESRKELRVAAALISIESSKQEESIPFTLRQSLDDYQALKVFKPCFDSNSIEVLRRRKPCAICLIGCHERTWKQQIRMWETRGSRKFTTHDLLRLGWTFQPECILLIADRANELDCTHNLRDLPQKTSVVVWARNVVDCYAGEFLRFFFDELLAGYLSHGLPCTESSYLRAVVQIPCYPQEEPCFQLMHSSHEDRVRNLLKDSKAQKVQIELPEVKLLDGKLLKILQDEFAPKIKKLMQPWKKLLQDEVFIRFNGFVHEFHMEDLKFHIDGLTLRGIKVKCITEGSILVHCVVSELNTILNWGLDVARELASSQYRLDSKDFFSLEDITGTGVIVETSALSQLYHDTDCADAIAELSRSKVPGERLFAALVQPDLTFEAVHIAARLSKDVKDKKSKLPPGWLRDKDMNGRDIYIDLINNKIEFDAPKPATVPKDQPRVWPVAQEVGPSAPPAGRRKGLLVGINYKGLHSQDGGHVDLQIDVIKDVEAVGEILKKQGFEIRMVLEKNASQNNILRSIHWLVKDAAKGDALVFMFAGHCTQRRDRTKGGMSMCLVSVFLEIIESHVLWKMLVDPLTEGVRLTALLDCSNTDTANGLDLPWVYDVKIRRWKVEMRPTSPWADVQLIAVGGEGAFTNALLNILQNDVLLYEDLLDELQRVSFESPTLSSSQAFDVASRCFSLTDSLFLIKVDDSTEGHSRALNIPDVGGDILLPISTVRTDRIFEPIATPVDFEQALVPFALSPIMSTNERSPDLIIRRWETTKLSVLLRVKSGLLFFVGLFSVYELIRLSHLLPVMDGMHTRLSGAIFWVLAYIVLRLEIKRMKALMPIDKEDRYTKVLVEVANGVDPKSD